MRKLIVLALFLIAVGASAQTEDDLVRYASERRSMVDAGTLSELEFFRDLHAKTAAMPASYSFKAENLRWIGERIDILEAVEAGKITPEKARRIIAEKVADYEEAELRRKRAESDAEQRRAQEQAQRQAAHAAHAAQVDAQRRALALQMLQNNMNRQPYQVQPYQVQPYVIPTRPTTNCRSYRFGNDVHTDCR